MPPYEVGTLVRKKHRNDLAYGRIGSGCYQPSRIQTTALEGPQEWYLRDGLAILAHPHTRLHPTLEEGSCRPSLQ